MDWFEQAMSDLGDAVEDVVEWVGDTAEAVVEAVVDVVEDVVEVVVDVVEDVVEVVVDVVEDVVDWTLTVADTVIFDPVDFITGGVIDIDYEDGQLTGALNLGIASVGISVGEQGFAAHAGFDLGIASGEISYDSDDGLAMSGSIGIDWGPLPYAEGHMDIGLDGEISIGGQIQGTLPLPFGSIGGEIAGELYRDADGTWGATSTVDVLLDGPGDTGASFHNDASIELGPEGFAASTTTDILLDGPADTGARFHNDASVALGREGFEASTTTDIELDGPLGSGAELHSDASIDLQADGDVLFEAGIEAGATGLGGKGVAADANVGFSNITDEAGNIVTTAGADAGILIGDKGIDAEAEFVGTRAADGERSSSVSGDVDVTGFELTPGDGTQPVVEVPVLQDGHSINNPAVASLRDLAGTGNLSDALTSGEANVEQAVELVESGAFDDFSSDIISSEITEAAAEEVWDDLGQ